MQRGFLSQYFEGVAIKRLRPVEVCVSVSNQHEFNANRALRCLLGENRTTFEGRFLWLSGENEGVSAEGRVTWYDARENHPTRTEYRLYFSSNTVMDQAQAGDLLIVARRADQSLYMIVVAAGSTLENQLCWLFGVSDIGNEFNYRPIGEARDPEVDFAVRYILEELGVEIEEADTSFLDTILEPYLEKGFPTTTEFSALARNTLRFACPLEEPDNTLLSWMEHEEKLFKRLERHFISQRLRSGFCSTDAPDVDSFIKFSLSVHNRRKSRVGSALENHLEALFTCHGIRFARGQATENKSRPDFVFPGIAEYRDVHYPSARLTMLGVKSTCKDRWRQVLTEAARISSKHLLTLEPSISESQTFEMAQNKLQLVLPEKLHATYKTEQRSSLWTVASFVRVVLCKQ
ncbi:MAG: restriction endonuclease [Firmicutes bacterium]|nr:restriction endonuclease [Dethiobacter sp.]MBS3889209.1 restriction endonuclease [Bacillota bacterium]MBS4054735.1 restriction endonuclease [Thermaerobacter sp.]